jgi:hypothetical protein
VLVLANFSIREYYGKKISCQEFVLDGWFEIRSWILDIGSWIITVIGQIDHLQVNLLEDNNFMRDYHDYGY